MKLSTEQQAIVEEEQMLWKRGLKTGIKVGIILGCFLGMDLVFFIQWLRGHP
jgi:hypothetical protein